MVKIRNDQAPVKKSNRIKGEYPYYGANGITDWINQYKIDGIFLLIGQDGTVINPDNSPILNWAEGKIWVNNHAHILEEKNNPEVYLRFLYYYLSTISIKDYVHGTPPKLTQKDLKQILIPLIPLDKQKQIVDILEKFNLLINDISAGIPAEIKLRNQQYNYYKNKLLSFKQKSN